MFTDGMEENINNPERRRRSLKRVSSKLKTRRRLSFLPRIDKIDREILKAFKTNDAFLIELINKNVPACNVKGWLKLQKKIGEGSFGQVNEVCVPKDKCKHQAVLKKSIFRDSETKAAFINEAIILNYIWDLQLDSKASHGKSFKIDYRHFILYFHHWFNCSAKVNGKQVQVGYQLLEKGGMSLLEAMTRKRSDKWWLNVLGQILTAIEDMNRIKINHNDLHEGNVILLKPNSVQDVLVKIIDFGAASIQSGILDNKEQRALTSGLPTFFFDRSPSNFKENRDLVLLFSLLAKVVNPEDDDEFIPMTNRMADAITEIAALPEDKFNVKNARSILSKLK